MPQIDPSFDWIKPEVLERMIDTQKGVVRDKEYLCLEYFGIIFTGIDIIAAPEETKGNFTRASKDCDALAAKGNLRGYLRDTLFRTKLY